MLYSTYGCIQHLTNAIAESVLGAGAEIGVKRVPELMSPEVAKQASEKPEQSAPVARPEELADYDAIITGSSTRSNLLSGPRHWCFRLDVWRNTQADPIRRPGRGGTWCCSGKQRVRHPEDSARPCSVAAA
jgi:hypothetical protein